MGQNKIMGNNKAQDEYMEDKSHFVIWDLPLRLFHWALLVSVVGAIGSGKNGFMFWHEKFGLTIIGLVVFRIIWGFVGSHHARFANFMVGPKKVVSYIALRRRGDRSHIPGHAPTGAYATILILAVLLVMAALGTMSNDDILYEGPLAAYVGAFTHDARSYHHLMEKAVFFVIALHVIALVVYRLALKINLIPAMVHGGKDLNVMPISRGRQWAGLMLLVLAVLAAQSLGLLGDRFY